MRLRSRWARTGMCEPSARKLRPASIEASLREMPGRQQEEDTPMTLSMFDPPGFLDDLNPEQKNAWSAFLTEQFDRAAQGNPEEFEFDGPREQLFNPLTVPTDADAQEVDITWVAFPRNVTVSSVSDLQRWRRADASRDLQDEYCEWSSERDPDTDKITHVTFTCEGPEYWEYLANTAPA